MLVTEIITIDNKEFRHNFSDEGFMIERDGVQYSDAVDPIEFEYRVYTETNIKIEE